MNLKEAQELHDMHNEWKSDLPWKAWGSWFSWGSPVGLSIFFISIAIVIVLLRYAFVVLR
jgi:hypothetical protein